MNSENILLFNAVLYSLVLFFFYIKNKLSIGLLVWLLYAISSWSSYFLCLQPHFKGTIHDNDITIIPFIYLFTLLFLCIYPLVKIKSIGNEPLNFKNGKILKNVLIFVSVFQVIIIIVNLPSLSTIISAPSGMLANYREEVYVGGNSILAKIAILNRFKLMYSGFQPIAAGLSIILLISYHKNRKIVILFFITTLLEIGSTVILMVSRGIMVSYIILYLLILFSCRNFLSRKIKRSIFLYSIMPLFILFSFFWAISVSRFGDLANYMIFKYLGEPMINFNGILFDGIKENTLGRAYFNPVFRYLFNEENFITCDEKWTYIENIIKTPAFLFYSFIGGLIIDFGKFFTMIIVVIIHFIEKKLFNASFNLGKIIVLITLIYLFSYGLFLFPLQGFQGNLMILYTIILYKLFNQKSKKYEVRNINLPLST